MRILAITLSFLVITGCSGAVRNFVGGAKTAPPLPSTTPPPTSGAVSKTSLQLSPGYMNATNTGVGMEAHVAPTQQVLSGGGISAELTLSRTRGD